MMPHNIDTLNNNHLVHNSLGQCVTLRYVLTLCVQC